MNTYTFHFNSDFPGTVVLWDVTNPLDVAAARRTCRAFGYLWLAGKSIDTIADSPIDADTGLLAKFFCNKVTFMTPKRLPSSLEAQEYPASTTLSVTSILPRFTRASTDDSMTDVISNLDKPIVTAGSLITAITEPGADISNELDTQLRIPIGGASGPGRWHMNIGIASANAQDGVYQTPFAAAVAFAVLNPNQGLTNPPILFNGVPMARDFSSQISRNVPARKFLKP